MTAASPESIYFSEIVTPPVRPARFNDALGPGNRVHDHSGEEEPGTRHQKWRNRFNRKPNSKVSRTPNQIEGGEGDDDPNFCRRGHEAMTICHSRDRATIRLLRRIKYQMQ